MTPHGSGAEFLRRIRDALEAAAPFIPGSVKPEYKAGDDPVTEADRMANRVLRKALVRNGEGWLSELPGLLACGPYLLDEVSSAIESRLLTTRDQ